MKKFRLLLLTALMSATMSLTAFAGAWLQDTTGRWYQNDDGGYTTGNWQTIDGKMYYFGADGYMLFNTITPDGCYVGLDGAWDGQPANIPANTTTVAAVVVTPVPELKTSTSASGISSTPYDGYTIVANTNTKKYHNPSCNSVSDISQGNLGYCSDASYLSSQGYAACKRCH